MASTRHSDRPVTWLRVARLARRLSQRELATAARISQPALSHIETGDAEPRFSTQRRLAEALGYDVDEVFPPPGKRSPSFELREWARALNGTTKPRPGRPRKERP
jgi:transcriptional regulator with XRE-family HTH domain